MKFTIGKKLGLGFATVLALMLISSVLTYVEIAGHSRNRSDGSDKGVHN